MQPVVLDLANLLVYEVQPELSLALSADLPLGLRLSCILKLGFSLGSNLSHVVGHGFGHLVIDLLLLLVSNVGDNGSQDEFFWSQQISLITEVILSFSHRYEVFSLHSLEITDNMQLLGRLVSEFLTNTYGSTLQTCLGISFFLLQISLPQLTQSFSPHLMVYDRNLLPSKLAGLHHLK